MSNRKYHELSCDEIDESEDSTLINEFKEE